MERFVLESDDVLIEVGGDINELWSYRLRGFDLSVAMEAPRLEIDGILIDCRISPESHEHRLIRENLVEHRITGPLVERPDLTLSIVLRLPVSGSSLVRVRYEIGGPGRMTKSSGSDELRLLSVRCADEAMTEVRVSDFDTLVHSYRVSETPLLAAVDSTPTSAVGPIVVSERNGCALILAYEHGAQAPDSFWEFRRESSTLSLSARKGAYLDRQALPYTTIWFIAGAVPGGLEDAASAFRNFILNHQSEFLASRSPYVFYNTWAMQERVKWWHGGKYLDPMTDAALLNDIDVASDIGVDVYVIDTGWYGKTGDWEVNAQRFSDDLLAIRERLESKSMQLGLWFGPTSAALSSHIVTTRPELQLSWLGTRPPPVEIWESEESAVMCLVSDYAQYFAAQLIRLHEETGVTYFKWDAVGQYGCDDPNHDHGDESHSAAERADSYAYQLPLVLTAIAQEVSRAVPGAIVDFDVTEPHRSVGLAFLSAGKYFLVNNGPYTTSFDIPTEEGTNPNLLFYPGTARARNARTTLEFDRWIPSTLFLCHYLPDDEKHSDLVANLASMMLGHGGIWGELGRLSPEGRALIRDLTDQYARFRGALRDAVPIRTGRTGGSPEIHEKVSAKKGMVIAFSPFAHDVRYMTRNPVGRTIWHTGGAEVSFLRDGRAAIDFHFTDDSAVIVGFS